eukprot:3521647-Prymnesium_polylepis.1
MREGALHSLRQARYRGRTSEYPGVLVSNAKNRWAVLYDDGVKEAGVLPRLIRRIYTQQAPAESQRRGEFVEAVASAKRDAAPSSNTGVTRADASWRRRVCMHDKQACGLSSSSAPCVSGRRGDEAADWGPRLRQVQVLPGQAALRWRVHAQAVVRESERGRARSEPSGERQRECCSR